MHILIFPQKSLFFKHFFEIWVVNKTSVVNSIKLTLTSKEYLKEFLDECAKRNEIDRLGLREKKITFFRCFWQLLHSLQF